MEVALEAETAAAMVVEGTEVAKAEATVEVAMVGVMAVVAMVAEGREEATVAVKEVVEMEVVAMEAAV